MITAHSWSAAYVKARQAEESAPVPLQDQHATYEPACVSTWLGQQRAMDDTMVDQEKEV